MPKIKTRKGFAKRIRVTKTGKLMHTIETEQFRAALAWGDAYFQAARTVCLISTDNIASIRVAEKCGYRESERTLFDGSPTLFFVREKPD